MTEQPSAALSTALAYYQAWTGKDLDRAMRYVAEGVVCENPTGRIEGLEAFRQFMTPFAQMLTGSDLLGAYGDADTAVLVYNPHTTLVADAAEARAVHRPRRRDRPRPADLRPDPVRRGQAPGGLRPLSGDGPTMAGWTRHPGPPARRPRLPPRPGWGGSPP